MGVAQEPGLQRRALLKGRPELRGRDAQGLSGCLDHVTVRAAFNPEDNRQTRHAFWTNQADLDPTLRGVGEDRYNAVFGKVDLLDRLPCLDQPLPQFEGDGLKIGLEQIEIVAVQREKKAGHGSLPRWGKSTSCFEPSPNRLRPRVSASDECIMGRSKSRYNRAAHANRSYVNAHKAASKTSVFRPSS